MGLFSSGKTQRTADIKPTVGVTSPNGPRSMVKLVKQTDPANSRIDLEKKGAGVDLLKRFDKAGMSLSKRDLTGIRAEAVMLLDHSGSMSFDYQSGTVQALVERALGFALQIDGDGTVPVIRFDSSVKAPVDVTVANYANITQNKLYEPRKMGSTNLTAALSALKTMAAGATSPIFAIIVTDGQPDNTTTAEELVRELESYPVFLKFLSIQSVPWLDHLDDMSRTVLDNADAKDINGTETDLEFADKMVDEWDTWIKAALTAGVLF